MERVSVELGPVQETLLIPLLGRAEETRRHRLIHDPKSVEIVERLDTSRRTMVAESILDGGWVSTVARHPEPYLFVSEAVLIYLEAADVEAALRQIGGQFRGTRLLMDTTSAKMVESQHKHDAMKVLPKESWFRWKCDDPRIVETWGLTLLSSETFLDAPADVIRSMPFPYPLLVRLLPSLLRRRVEGYRINLFEFDDRGTHGPVAAA